jgi:hypothetical protein
MKKPKKIPMAAEKKMPAGYERDQRRILKFVPGLRKIKKGCK